MRTPRQSHITNSATCLKASVLKRRRITAIRPIGFGGAARSAKTGLPFAR